MSPIVTPAAPDVQPTPASIEIDRASRLDGCPSCVLNVEAPSSTYATADGFLSNYVCLTCGHAWSTSWRD